MTDLQSIESPDQRYSLRRVSKEMRMSHSVINAALWERVPQRLLLEIGDWQWSSEQIAWSADSQWVTIGLRRIRGMRLVSSSTSTLSGRSSSRTPQPLRSRFLLRRSTHS